jgi:hypothetical protein
MRDGNTRKNTNKHKMDAGLRNYKNILCFCSILSSSFWSPHKRRRQHQTLSFCLLVHQPKMRIKESSIIRKKKLITISLTFCCCWWSMCTCTRMWSNFKHIKSIVTLTWWTDSLWQLNLVDMKVTLKRIISCAKHDWNCGTGKSIKGSKV